MFTRKERCSLALTAGVLLVVVGLYGGWVHSRQTASFDYSEVQRQKLINWLGIELSELDDAGLRAIMNAGPEFEYSQAYKEAAELELASRSR